MLQTGEVKPGSRGLPGIGVQHGVPTLFVSPRFLCSVILKLFEVGSQDIVSVSLHSIRAKWVKEGKHAHQVLSCSRVSLWLLERTRLAVLGGGFWVQPLPLQHYVPLGAYHFCSLDLFPHLREGESWVCEVSFSSIVL